MIRRRINFSRSFKSITNALFPRYDDLLTFDTFHSFVYVSHYIDSPFSPLITMFSWQKKDMKKGKPSSYQAVSLPIDDKIWIQVCVCCSVS